MSDNPDTCEQQCRKIHDWWVDNKNSPVDVFKAKLDGFLKSIQATMTEYDACKSVCFDSMGTEYDAVIVVQDAPQQSVFKNKQ